MDERLLLLLQILLPLLLGYVATAYLRSVLLSLLEDMCGTPVRAEFWVRFVRILCMGAPLAWLMMTGVGSGTTAVAGLRASIGATVAGILSCLSVAAWVVWKRIPRVLVLPASRSEAGNNQHDLPGAPS